MAKIKLDDYEKDLLDSLDLGEWESIPDLNSEISDHIQIAKNTMKKYKRVNIRLTSSDLLKKESK